MKRNRTPKIVRCHQVILSHIPIYPDSVSTVAILARMQVRDEMRFMPDTNQQGLYNRLTELIKDQKIVRVAQGYYAKPSCRADFRIDWRHRKPRKPTLSEELREANAALRAELEPPMDIFA